MLSHKKISYEINETPFTSEKSCESLAHSPEVHFFYIKSLLREKKKKKKEEKLKS